MKDERRTLRSKRARAALWLAAGGKCQQCGTNLPDDWHADHIEPWSRGGATAIRNMQALCPACNIRKGGSMSHRNHLISMRDSFRPRKGQEEAWDYLASVDPASEDAACFVKTTGYGKSITGIGAYGVLRDRGLVDRCLVLSPSDEQRRSWVNDAPADFALLGLHYSGGADCRNSHRDFHAIRGGRELFSATYQQLDVDHYRYLMADGRWLVICDEAHHLAEGGQWAERVASLPSVFRIYMTATPFRTDRKRLCGVPELPVVNIDYERAHREGAVKTIRGYVSTYHVEIIDGDSVIKLSTEDVDQLEANSYEARKQIRYNESYLGHIVRDAINTLVRRRHEAAARWARTSAKDMNRMIVFAINCHHAAHVASSIQAFMDANDLGLQCEWVGQSDRYPESSKPDKENQDIIERFKKGSVHVLVQVGKAGEGFNVPAASVLLFLHLTKSPVKTLQEIGRGIRRLPWINDVHDDVCDVFVSSDSGVVEVLQDMSPSIDVEFSDPRDGDGRIDSGDNQMLLDIPGLFVTECEFDRTDTVIPGGGLPPDVADFIRRHPSVPVSDALALYQGRHAAGNGAVIVAESGTPAQEEMVRQQIKSAQHRYVNNLMRSGVVNGMEKKELYKRLNGQIKHECGGLSRSDMMPEELPRVHQILSDWNDRLKSSGWVPECFR